MPHGDRWQLFGNAEMVVNALLPVALDKGRLVRTYTIDVNESEGIPISIFRYFPEDHEEMGTVFLCLADDDEQLALASFYLLFKSQAPPVKIASITTERDENGIEGVVSGQTADGVNVSYFDPVFPANLKKYSTRKTLQVRLAALAYRVQSASEKTVTIDDPLMLRNLRAFEQGCTPDEVEDLSPMTVSPRETPVYSPGAWKDSQGDDFQFMGTVQSVEILDFLGMTVFVTDVKIHKGDSDITCTLYIPSSTLAAGVVLKQGLAIMGTAWMQGFLK